MSFPTRAIMTVYPNFARHQIVTISLETVMLLLKCYSLSDPSSFVLKALTVLCWELIACCVGVMDHLQSSIPSSFTFDHCQRL